MQSYGQGNIQQIQQAMMAGPINAVEAMKYSKQAVVTQQPNQPEFMNKR